MTDPFEMFANLKEPGRIPGAPSGRPALVRERKPRLRLGKTVKLSHPGSAPDRWDANPRVKSVKGKELELFTIGDLAKAIGRQPVTIRSWEDKGWLPKPVFRAKAPSHPGAVKTAKGRRLYSRLQVELVLKSANSTGILTLSNRGPIGDADAWAEFKRLVDVAWRGDVE